MKLFPSLALGWSIVWGACLFSSIRTSLGGVPFTVIILPLEKTRSVVYLLPVYAFAVWLAGIVLLYGLCLIHSKVGPKEKPPEPGG